MLNTRNEENHTVFYSCAACFVNTFTWNMFVSMPYIGLTLRNTCIPILVVAPQEYVNIDSTRRTATNTTTTANVRFILLPPGRHQGAGPRNFAAISESGAIMKPLLLLLLPLLPPPSNLPRGFHKTRSTVIPALGYRAIWGKGYSFTYELGVNPGLNRNPASALLWIRRHS